jgi:hypothetical protein
MRSLAHHEIDRDLKKRNDGACLKRAKIHLLKEIRFGSSFSSIGAISDPRLAESDPA